jgi:hypothetical protein
MEEIGLPDVPVVAKKLLDSAEVELKVKDAEITSLKEQVEALTDENKDLKIDINVLGLKKKKLGIKLKRLERKQFDRDVRTEFNLSARHPSHTCPDIPSNIHDGWKYELMNSLKHPVYPLLVS